MPLDLLDRSTPQTHFNAGISVDNMTWWFWIKAGMGLVVGALIVGLIGVIFWTVFWLGILAAIGRNFMR
jgi:hypothetical protein